MNPRYAQVALRAAHRCEYCHAPEVLFNFPFEVEHIVPLSLDGDDGDENLALACRACNIFKAAHTDGVDPVTQIRVRCFHPRQDRWEEHFVVSLASDEIVGLTAIGRATVMRLEMNSPAQVAARRQWLSLGVFP